MAGFEPAFSSLATRRSRPLCYTCTQEEGGGIEPQTMASRRFSGPLADHSAAPSKSSIKDLNLGSPPSEGGGHSGLAQCSITMRSAGIAPARCYPLASRTSASTLSPRAPRADGEVRTHFLLITNEGHIQMCFDGVHMRGRNRTLSAGIWRPARCLTCPAYSSRESGRCTQRLLLPKQASRSATHPR